MKRYDRKIPLSVLVQALVIGVIGGTPILFIAFNQIRRACGDRLFGSRQHFCTAHELSTWLLSLQGRTYLIVVLLAVAGFMVVRWSLHKIAS